MKSKGVRHRSVILDMMRGEKSGDLPWESMRQYIPHLQNVDVSSMGEDGTGVWSSTIGYEPLSYYPQADSATAGATGTRAGMKSLRIGNFRYKGVEGNVFFTTALGNDSNTYSVENGREGHIATVKQIVWPPLQVRDLDVLCLPITPGEEPRRALYAYPALTADRNRRIVAWFGGQCIATQPDFAGMAEGYASGFTVEMYVKIVGIGSMTMPDLTGSSQVAYGNILLAIDAENANDSSLLFQGVYRYGLFLNEVGGLEMWRWDDSKVAAVKEGDFTAELEEGQWYHIALCWAAGGLAVTCWVNGNSKGTVTYDSIPRLQHDAPPEDDSNSAGGINVNIHFGDAAWQIESIRVSDSVLYSTGFDAPEIPFSSDGAVVIWDFEDAHIESGTYTPPTPSNHNDPAYNEGGILEHLKYENHDDLDSSFSLRYRNNSDQTGLNPNLVDTTGPFDITEAECG